MQYEHRPVMLEEVIKYLQVKPGRNYIDCTLGGAGYTLKIAKLIGNKGRILAIDMDQEAIKNAQEKVAVYKLNNVILALDNFKNLTEIVATHCPEIKSFAGVVLDLGLSSFQLADKRRGFSFHSEGPLDMAYGEKSEISTQEIINNYSLEDLTNVFRKYGEEKYSYRIAKEIVLQRQKKPITKAKELAEIVKSKYPKRHYYKIHPATKVFQALRIETNKDLKNLEIVLAKIVKLLKNKGRIVVVSFHSGEDRVVKRFFKEQKKLLAITKKPLVPQVAEKQENPRARSAKLRVAIKLDNF